MRERQKDLVMTYSFVYDQPTFTKVRWNQEVDMATGPSGHTPAVLRESSGFQCMGETIHKNALNVKL